MLKREESFSENEEAKRQREREERIKNGIWRPRIFEQFPEVICAASTKEFPGLSFLREPDRLKKEINPRKLRAARSLVLFLRGLDPGLAPKMVAYPELAHSARVRVISDTEIRFYIKARRKIEKTDGLITEIPGLALMVLGADCPSVGVYDPEHRVIGVFHSGWKGTAINITLEGLLQMKETFETNPNKIYAVVGPGISDNYEIGEDVYQKFLSSGNFSEEELDQIFKPKGGGKYNLNLHQAIFFELLKTGVPENQIEITALRTDEDNDLFPSYRTEGKEADRFAFAMVLKRTS